MNCAIDGTVRQIYQVNWAIDGTVYIGGSANVTGNACRGEENLVVVRNDDFLTKYLEWFWRLWHDSQSSFVKGEDLLARD